MTGEEQETHDDNAVMDIGNGFYTFGMQINHEYDAFVHVFSWIR